MMGWNQTYSEKDVQIWTDKMTQGFTDADTDTELR
jgi:hypothetical protein